MLDSGGGGQDLGLPKRRLLVGLRSSLLWSGCLGLGLHRGMLDRLLINLFHLLSDGVVDLVGAKMRGVDLVLTNVFEVVMLSTKQVDELVSGLEAGKAVVLLLGEIAHELGQVLPHQLLLALGELPREEGWRLC